MDRQARTMVLTAQYGIQIVRRHFAIHARGLLAIVTALLIVAPTSAHGANTPCSAARVASPAARERLSSAGMGPSAPARNPAAPPRMEWAF
jgi:hypothetical protein